MRTKIFQVILLFFTLIFCGFLYLGLTFNVYQYKVIGALAELLWLPTLLILTSSFIANAVLFYKSKCNFRTTFPYSLLAIISTILAIYFS
jgi:hypothetical protein